MKTRAAVLRKGGEPWEVTELDLDEPTAGEVLIRFGAAGLCHSDGTGGWTSWSTTPPRSTAYSASKAAVLGFTRALSADVAPWGVTVNAIAPGMVATSRTTSPPPWHTCPPRPAAT